MEILKLLSGLSDSYYPRVYIVADSDSMSLEKIENFEASNKVPTIVKFHLLFALPPLHTVHTDRNTIFIEIFIPPSVIRKVQSEQCESWKK